MIRKQTNVGSVEWNDTMYKKHPTPYNHPLAGYIEKLRVNSIKNLVKVKPDDRVLEIGCEGGNLLNLLPTCKELVGLDISKEALKDAKNLLGNRATFVHADAQKKIRLPQAKFDVIICSQTLEHVEHPEKIMKNINYLAGPNTKIIISVPNEIFILQVKRFLKSLKLMSVFMKKIEDHTSEWHIQVFNDTMVKALVSQDFRMLKSIRVLNIYLVYLLQKSIQKK